MHNLLDQLKKVPLIALMGAIPIGPWLCGDGIPSLAAQWPSLASTARGPCTAEPTAPCTPPNQRSLPVNPLPSPEKQIAFPHAPLA